jgi:hypothetical protein
LFLAVAPITEAPLDLALRCDLSECQLPYCFCSKDGTNIPKDLNAEDVSEKEKNTLDKVFKQKNMKLI